MIVEPGFLSHYKTRALIEALDETAPLYVLRLWAFCQIERKTTLPSDPSKIARICEFREEPTKLVDALLDNDFLDSHNGEYVVHQWAEHNTYLVRCWENGRKGGRPSKKPTANPAKPTANPTEPTANLYERRGEERRREEEELSHVRARDATREDWDRWCLAVREAHDRCAQLGDIEIVSAIRVYPESWPDEAISAFSRQMAGAWMGAPIRELEKYLRHSEENAGNGKGKRKDEPMTDVGIPLAHREAVV